MPVRNHSDTLSAYAYTCMCAPSLPSMTLSRTSTRPLPVADPPACRWITLYRSSHTCRPLPPYVALLGPVLLPAYLSFRTSSRCRSRYCSALVIHSLRVCSRLHPRLQPHMTPPLWARQLVAGSYAFTFC
jgi:hypothetical protein